ncbi:MAG: hypothetical protein MI749_07565, partial [Desulfovibrionales bacterium]|nr:hypothetical protein [Desulfovibrionales bacterium]
ANKLKARMEEQTQETQQIMQDALQNLSNELQKSIKRELNTIESVLADGVQSSISTQKEMFQSLRRTLKLPIGISLLVTIIGCVGLISLTSLWFQYEKNRLAELRQMNFKLQAQVDVLSDWQITTNKVDGVRFLTFPKGMKLSIRQTRSGTLPYFWRTRTCQS